MGLNVSSGRITEPLRVLLYGQEGVGKTTWAAGMPAPLWLDAERGSLALDVPRITLDDDGRTRPDTMAEVSQLLRDLYREAHDYQTLVIDTADSMESILHADLCARRGWAKGIEQPGYGKGYVAAEEEWHTLLHQIDTLRAHRGMHIVWIAHSRIAHFSNPAGDDYMRFEPALHKKACACLKGWADVIGFAAFEDLKLEKGKAIASGRRLLHLQRTAAYDAKCRLDIAPVLDLDCSLFRDAAGIAST